mgnify:CR=1 FL=1
MKEVIIPTDGNQNNNLKCRSCGVWDNPAVMYISKSGGWHHPCYKMHIANVHSTLVLQDPHEASLETP